MRFKAEPNLFVRVSNKYVQRVAGIKGFHFDANGEYETENELLIKLLSQHYEAVEGVPQTITPEVIESAPQVDSEPINGMDDNTIRALGKARKIKHWHIMSIEKLKKELEG